MKHRTLTRLILTGAFLVAGLTPAYAQLAEASGRVNDATGAVVPKAQVTFLLTTTGHKRETITNEEGYYTMPFLQPGTYQITVRKEGFKPIVQSGITLVVEQVVRFDFKLETGAVTETVNITADTPLLETETGAVSDSRNRKQLRALPLTLRRAWDYFTMSPQVTKAPTGFALGLGGAHNNQSEANIDGITITPPGGGFGFGPLLDRTENLQEMRVDISGNSAEYGTPGSVTMTTRGGTNDFHGAFSDYYSSPFMRARNPFATARGTGISHRLTFSAGGPVYLPKVYDGRNKTFFFATLEMGAGSPSTVLRTQTAPLAAWRAGDFSRVTGLFLRDPSKTGACTAADKTACFTDNKIPANRLNPVSVKLQEKFYALPNFGSDPNALVSQNYRENRLNPFSHQPTLTLRFDHRFNENSFVYGRFIGVYWNIPNFEPSPLVTEQFQRTRNLRSWLVSYTHTFNPTLVNEARWGLSSDHLPIESRIKGKAIVQELGLQGLAADLPDVGGMPRIGFVGLGLSALGAQLPDGSF